MIKATTTVLLILFWLIQTDVFGQVSERSVFQQLNTIEKVYLQTDKRTYISGDTIWFKAYVVSGSLHQLSSLSNVLNVDIVNQRDSIKQNIKVLMTSGLCHGGLPLPDSVKEGNYRLRAYTNWMRNTGEEYFFDRNIRVVNTIIANGSNSFKKPPAKNNIANKSVNSKTIVRFFPEGGTLVSDLDCKIAFKAVNATGQGVAVKGIVSDENGNIVSDFSGNRLGMGVFYLNAQEGKIYKARITDADGKEDVVQLPQAVNNGYAFRIASAIGDKIHIGAQSANANQNGALTLIGSVGGQVYYKATGKPGSNSFVTLVPKNKFPTGIVQFTLFASNGEPLNERLFFNRNNDQLQFSISPSLEKNYAAEQKAILSLTSKIGNNQPVQGSFSVSVVNESIVPVDKGYHDNILSNLLLTSDLKGYVEDPGYYFTAPNQNTDEDLDALMLTQGYRKFSWQPAFYSADTGLAISGRLTKLSGKPVANEKVTLYTMNGGFFSLDTVTNAEGRFVFKHLVFADSMKFVVQCDEKERDRHLISVDSEQLKAISNKNAPELALNDSTDMTIFKQNSKELYTQELKYNYNGKAKLLKEVNIKAPQKDLASPNSVLKGIHADYVVTGKQLVATKWGNTSDVLIGLIPGLLYNHNHQLTHSTDPKAPPIRVNVDGIFVSDINMISPRSIESVEFIYPGALFITTKRGITDDDMTYTENMPGYKKFSPKGFYKVREFYSPQYNNPATNKEIANLRTTIYWNPSVITDKDGNASFEYFNATKGTYKVTVEGIDGEGHLGRAEYKYEVK